MESAREKSAHSRHKNIRINTSTKLRQCDANQQLTCLAVFMFDCQADLGSEVAPCRAPVARSSQTSDASQTIFRAN